MWIKCDDIFLMVVVYEIVYYKDLFEIVFVIYGCSLWVCDVYVFCELVVSELEGVNMFFVFVDVIFW